MFSAAEPQLFLFVIVWHSSDGGGGGGGTRGNFQYPDVLDSCSFKNMEDDQLDWGIEEDDWLPISSDCRITTDCAEKEVEAVVSYSSRPIFTTGREAVVNTANHLAPCSGGRCATTEWTARRINTIAEQHLQTPSLTEDTTLLTIDQQLKEGIWLSRFPLWMLIN